VSGAMLDFEKTLVIGNNAFGKRRLQSVVHLSNGAVLRLAVAEHCLPSGFPINRSDDKNCKERHNS